MHPDRKVNAIHRLHSIYTGLLFFKVVSHAYPPSPHLDLKSAPIKKPAYQYRIDNCGYVIPLLPRTTHLDSKFRFPKKALHSQGLPYPRTGDKLPCLKPNINEHRTFKRCINRMLQLSICQEAIIINPFSVTVANP